MSPPPTHLSHPPVEHLGVRLYGLTLGDLDRLLRAAVADGESTIIAHHNLHSVYLCRSDDKLRRFYSRAAWAHVDGMALVFTARLAGLPLAREHRVTYVDWIWPLLRTADEEGWRIFHLGGKPGVFERAVERVRSRFPDLALAGHHGYFDARPESAENGEVLAAIDAFAPHLLMVGMGMPRQEHWILDHAARLAAPVVLPCGACMDYLAHEIPTPPRWSGRVGLEWLFRLASEPRRLAGRYLVEPLVLLGPVVSEAFARRILRRGPARGSGR